MSKYCGIAVLCGACLAIPADAHENRNTEWAKDIGWAICIGVRNPPPKKCDTDDVCAKGEFCFRSKCIPGCRTNSQCPLSSQVCYRNRCRDRGRCTPGRQQRCYDGPSATRGVGECREGLKYCIGNGTWSACEGQLLPQRETCDGQDNDCNGRVDDGVECQCQPGSARRCYTGPSRTVNVGVCRPGVQYCQMDHSWGNCVGQERPRPEVCDGKDNDCDGRIDQGITCQCKPGAVRSCYSHNPRTAGVGECRRGKQVCLTNHRWSAECFEQRGPVAEVCDGKDNNCNGAVDEGCLGGMRRPSLGGFSRVGSLSILGRPRLGVFGSRGPAPAAREVRAAVCSPDDIRRQLGAIRRDLDSAQQRLRTTEQSLSGSARSR